MPFTDAPDRQNGAVSNALAGIHQNMDRLEHVTQMLGEKLAPILAPARPEPGLAEGGEKSASPNSEVAESLNKAGRQLDQLIERLQHYERRLDL